MTGFKSKRETAQDKLEDDDIQDYKRPWVGLTDEEYQQVLKQHDGAGLIAFYNLIHDALRSKNT